ncbi:DcrB-related protein [Morganella morganii]|uniref:DcrB-related protein n=1 Tax=Morganella morganii TaxID=582 RepID=UPI0003A197F0|nr:DcrB-related protein [Morganella morganii]MBC3995482.1 DcrB-related protein [Morganella morganii]
MYQLNEGQFLSLPAHWLDTSMNVFRDPDSQRSFIVARATIKPGQSLPDEMRFQCEQLTKVAANIHISDFEPVHLALVPEAEALETQLSFFRSGSQFYQKQLAVLGAGSRQILLFSYTSADPFNTDDDSYWLRLKNTLTLNS